jgi:hypothetical protein
MPVKYWVQLDINPTTLSLKALMTKGGNCTYTEQR